MRIRIPFAIAFAIQALLAGYFIFSSTSPPINDRLGHFLTFFALTLTFYWIFETTRRRAVHITFISITIVASTVSLLLQLATNNVESLDLYGILLNMLGSLSALGMAAWYHKRMLERKRERSKNRYTALATTADDDVEVNSNPSADLDHDLGLELEADVERGDGETDLGDIETGRRDSVQIGEIRTTT